MEIILYLLLPISSIAFVFLEDKKKGRKEVMNALLIMNAIFFLSPLIMAYTNTPEGESMWNENSGGGASLWLYIIVLPISLIAQFVLITLKIVFATKSK